MAKVKLNTPKKAMTEPTVEEIAEQKKQKAVEAVQLVEAKRDEYHRARDEWDENFPDAKEALDEVKKLEDEVNEAIKEAKPLVAASGEKEIGEFTVQYPKSTPTYDGKKLLKLLLKIKDGATTKDKADRLDLIMDLYDRGLITEIGVDAKVAGIINERDPTIQKVIGGAWVPSEPLTPRVSVPKI
jgi:hypothetical protein